MWYVLEALRSVFDLKRTCPKCHRTMLVKSDKRDKTVPCTSCGAKVPPNRKA